MKILKLPPQINLYEVLLQCILVRSTPGCAVQLPENTCYYQTYSDVTSEQRITQN